MNNTQGHSIQQHTKSGSYSSKATYRANGETVVVEEWVHDSMGIIPSGTIFRTLPIAAARQEYKQRKAMGWR